jgi:hypothetical protein
MADFVKDNDLQFALQYKNFSDKVTSATYAALFGLSATEIAAIQADAEWATYVITRHNTVPNYSQDWTKLKNQLRYGGDGATMPPFPTAPDVSTPPMMPVVPNIEGRLRSRATTLKAHANYSKTIGEDLGIEAPESSVDYSTYKPEFTLEIAGGQVLIKWKKLKADGINIYRKKGSGAWEKIDFDLKPNYLDKSTSPPEGTTEQWSYRLRYFKNEVEVGEMSIEQTIKVVGI